MPGPRKRVGQDTDPSPAFWRWCAPAHQPMKAKTMTTSQTERIRELNDRFRQTGIGGRLMLHVMERVQTFTDFTPDNDRIGEHDFGAFTIDQHKVFWKIDYYAHDMMHGSEDPADPEKTVRVLTIMLAQEY